MNDAGKELLITRLKRSGLLNPNVQGLIPFDFINYNNGLMIDGTSPSNKWDYRERLYCNSRSVPRRYEIKCLPGLNNEGFVNPITGEAYFVNNEGPNGLLAGLGSFNFRALPKGYIYSHGDGTYDIQVTDLAVYAQDTFDFEDEKPYFYWSKEVNAFSLDPYGLTSAVVTDFVPSNSYHFLSNGSFQKFGSKYNKGQDFYVFSEPKLIENFTPINFKYSE